MFAKIQSTLLVAVLALPMLASATAIPRGDPGAGGQCNTGSIQCCGRIGTVDELGLGALVGLLGIVLGPIDGLLGLQCSPLNIVGIGGNSCTAQPACCNGNTFGGLISVGCSPIALGL